MRGMPSDLDRLVCHRPGRTARGRNRARGWAHERPHRTAAPAGAFGLVVERCDPDVRQLVGEREQYAAECDAVGDAVVDPTDERGAVAVAVHEVELPERLRAVEGPR